MNLKHIKYYSLAAIIAVTFGATSCVGDLDVTPINPQVTQTFDKDAVFAKVYAAFSLTGQQGAAGNNDIDIPDEGRYSLYRCLWNQNELTTDEAICAWGDAEVIELNSNSWSSTNTSTEGLYARLYFIVVSSNHFLEQTAGMTDAATVKQRAEVRFLRALGYYYLMDLYGNVPFTENISDQLPVQIKRADLYKYITKELTECEPDMYAPKAAPYYRVDKAANWLLKSRIFLNAQVYTGTAQWDSAMIYSKKVMDSGYTLTPDYKHLFMGDNAGSIDGSSVNKAQNEIIFPIASDGVKIKSWGSSVFLLGSTKAGDMPSRGTSEVWSGNRARAALVKKFFPDGTVPSSANLTTAAADDRALLYSIDRTVDVTKVTDFKKGLSVIKFSNDRADGGIVHDSQFPDMDIPFMRVAEAYLTYAEANLRSTNGKAADALKAINDLRTRSHATPIVGLNLDKVLDEWTREFYFEGRRRIDLIRFGYFSGTNYNWDWKGGVATGTSFDSHYDLMPLPPGDLNANSNLKQNKGY
ncbi:MAG: RagB/SusD domain protein [Bacteroidetes bacterium]|nr:RagB/SusD domain protein [Bacteroidota bacterium]